MSSLNWTPGIGDPTFGGWLTVGLYLAATLSIWVTVKTLGGVNTVALRERRAWIGIGVLFALLGINKQVDLQSALTELGRLLARQQGWYDQRHIVQLGFIAVVTAICAVLGVTFLFYLRRSSIQLWTALLGTAFVTGYVLLRAASFHNIDRFIGDAVLGVRWNWILEMGGIALVIAASEWQRRSI